LLKLIVALHIKSLKYSPASATMPFFQRIKEIFTGHHNEQAAHDDAVTDQRASLEKEANTPKQDQSKQQLHTTKEFRKPETASVERRTRGYLGSFVNGDRNKDFDRRAVRRAKRAPVVYEKRRPTHGNQIVRRY
jgi:hypothetical protein